MDNLTPTQKMTKARIRLLSTQPWFGSLACRLALEESSDVPIMATDGTKVWFNPEWAANASMPLIAGTLAHEVMHCALLHMYRRGARNIDKWNDACDYAVNPLLKKAGFELPQGVLMDSQYDGMSAETIYARLPDPKPGDGKPEPSPTGSFQDAPPEKDEPGESDEDGPEQEGQGKSKPMSAADWEVAAAQATAVTQKAGKTPGDADRACKEARKKPEDWRAILREFVQQQQPMDYSWSTPNRRHIGAGLYLPGIRKENMGAIRIAVDTSGSVSDVMLSIVADEITGIAQECRPESIDVVYCDYDIQSRQSFSPDDEIKLEGKGGGVTRFQPVMDDLAESFELPAVLIYFTDLENNSDQGPITEPDCPVLWVTPMSVARLPQFGQVIRIA